MSLTVSVSAPSGSMLLGNSNYVPLKSPMRCSKPFVSSSETRETLLDVPLLITTSEEDKKSKIVSLQFITYTYVNTKRDALG